ncbi:glycerate kinase [Tatumella punctata]
MKPMTFVLAPDSFKESMTAKEVCIAMERGLRRVFPEARYIHVPMADGGEGTTRSLVDATCGALHSVTVTGPSGSPAEAIFGISGDGTVGIIEMSSASGIQHTAPDNRNPLLATSYGTGQLVTACLNKGVRQIILGLGGSATNDGGAGMAEALGVRFYGPHHRQLSRGGGALGDLQRIDISGLDPRLNGVKFLVACDVTSPLCGDQGASVVFGPQKGATPPMVRQLDDNLAHYAQIICQQLGKNVADQPGAGAAGGLGAGLLAFTDCELKNGVEIILSYTRLKQHLTGADYCFTGEGRMDAQTMFGKTPLGVARLAKAAGVPVIAIAGSMGSGTEPLYRQGIDAIFGIIPHADSIDNLLRSGTVNIQRTCENVGRLLRLHLS